MMTAFRDLSIKQKLIAGTMLASSAALLVAVVVLLVYEMVISREAVVRNLSAQAEMIGLNSASAIVFNDPGAAAAVLSALRADRSITAAAIYTSDHRVLVRYVGKAIQPASPLPDRWAGPPDGAQFREQHLLLSRRIVLEAEALGTVVIQMSLLEMHQRIRRYLGIAGGILVLSFLVALAISSRMQQAIVAPMLQLAETAKVVSVEKNYSVRAPAGNRDELGLLITTFNQMLEQIELRDTELQEARDKLEQRVKERTAELAAAVQELQASEERYRQLFESSPQPIWVFDRDTLAFLAVNPAAVRHYSYSREEFLGMTIQDIHLPEDIPRLLEDVSSSSPQSESLATWRHRKKDGSMIHAEVHSDRLVFGGREASLVVVNDITERLRAEERFRAVAETATDAIVSADSRGNIVYFNKGAETMFGHPASEVLGEPLTRLMPDRFHQAHRGGLQRFLSTGEARVVGKSVELAGKRKSGQEFPLDLSLASWKAADEVFFTGILRDITARKQTEKELRERGLQLEVANQELEAFTYSVSHDLRAPLRHVDGFSKILLEAHGPKLDPEARRHLERIRHGTCHMGMLIDDLLNLSRVSRKQLQVQVAGLESVVKDVLEDLKPETQGREIEWRIDRLPFVECDPFLMRQVFANLLSNAVKFTRPREHAVIEVGHSISNGQPAVFVRDNGVGFSMKYADKLFGVFQRLHRPEDFDGTGVGLATVQRIIHRHGGRVWAEAELDKGATFYFTLAAPEQAAAANPSTKGALV